MPQILTFGKKPSLKSGRGPQPLKKIRRNAIVWGRDCVAYCIAPRKPLVLLRSVVILLLLFLSASPLRAQPARELYQQSRYGAIIRQYAGQDSLTPDENYLVGEAYHRSHRPAKAVPYYEAALKAPPKLPRQYLSLGEAYREVRQFRKSRRVFRKGRQANPDNQLFYTATALTYYYEDQHEKALNWARKAAEKDFRSNLPYLLLGKIPYLDNRDSLAYRNMRTYYRNVHSHYNYYREYLNLLARLELEYGSPEQAARFFGKVLRQDSSQTDALFGMSKASHQAGDTLMAQAIWQRMKRLYEEARLPENILKLGKAPVGQYFIGQDKVVIYRSLEAPEEITDVGYSFYRLSGKTGEVKRVLQLEKAVAFPGGPDFLLCENHERGHRNFGVGLSKPNLTYPNLKALSRSVFRNERGASSESLYRRR